jgi:hypothetical protein
MAPARGAAADGFPVGRRRPIVAHF